MGSTVVTVAGGAPPTYSWAGKPSAANVGQSVFVSDVGVDGSLWAWNGSKWVHESPIALALNGIIMGLPSSGTMGNNGALSAITALPFTFSDGCYLYFPANAIAAGSAAGMYWTVMSSTTAGTVYNNTYTGGTPAAPASPTPFSTTGPGAFVQTTASDITLLSVTCLGGVMGGNGRVSVETLVNHANSAGTKTVKHYFASSPIANLAGATTSNCSRFLSTVQNSNSQAIQRVIPNNAGAAVTPSVAFVSGANMTQLAINTANNAAIAITAQLSLATDFMMLVYVDIKVSPT